jgi:hypothetical protein
MNDLIFYGLLWYLSGAVAWAGVVYIGNKELDVTVLDIIMSFIIATIGPIIFYIWIGEFFRRLPLKKVIFKARDK